MRKRNIKDRGTLPFLEDKKIESPGKRERKKRRKREIGRTEIDGYISSRVQDRETTSFFLAVKRERARVREEFVCM